MKQPKALALATSAVYEIVMMAAIEMKEVIKLAIVSSDLLNKVENPHVGPSVMN